MKKSRLAFIAVAVIAAAAAAFYFMRPKPIAVTLAAVEKGRVEAIVSNTRAGTVKACRRTKMSPPSGGQIVSMDVKKGERVKAGQVLLTLWDKDLEAQKSLAEAQLETAKSEARQSCALSQLAASDAARSRALRAKGFISSEALESREANEKSSRAACDAAKGGVEQGASRVNAAKAALERLVLKAPFSGIVADISGELGEYATPSPPGIPTPPAIDLIDDSCLYVSAPIDEMDASALKVGEKGRITLDAVKGVQFPGTVRRVAPYVLDLEKQARTVEVEMDFDHRPKSLLAGYSADVEIVHDAHDGVLRLPTAAIMEGGRVLLYRPDGVLAERTVKVGLANWEYSEILSGLSVGERVVLSLDRSGVKAGARVVPEEQRAK